MSLAKIEIEVDDVLVDKVIHKFHLHGPRDAVNLALRNLLAERGDADSSLEEEEYDEFSDLSALQPPRRSEPA
jgi:Arc/MetJ family transcription regulator